MSWLDNEHNRTQTTDGWLEDETDKRTSFQRAFLNQPVPQSAFPWEARPELQRDAKGTYPGEAEHGIPDFLRTFRASLAKGPPATNRQS